MKISLIGLLACSLLAGCGHTTTVAPTVAPTVPAAVPAPAPKPAPVLTPDVEQAPPLEMTPDGRVRVKGDSWELDVPGESTWRPVESHYLFAMVNAKLKLLFFLDRDYTSDSLKVYMKNLVADMKKDGGTVKNQRVLKLNKADVGYLELQGKENHIGVWLFKAPNEVYTLACGGPEFTANKAVCEDLAKNLLVNTTSH